MTRTLLAMLLVTACSVPMPSRQYTCHVTADCEPGRTCDSDGYCALATVDAGDHHDATSVGTHDAMVDAGPVVMSFAVGVDCSGGRCRGGYNGTKDTATYTADKVCTDKGFAHSTAFTMTNDQPNGKFCTWTASMTWSCDNSCGGCNPMVNVTCTKP